MDQSDRGRFNNAITKLLQSTGGLRDVPTTMIGGYWMVLKDKPWPMVVGAMTRAMNDSTSHVTPAKLVDYCRPEYDQVAADKAREERYQAARSKADRVAELAGEKRFGALWRNSEFQAAKDVANMEYARRCNGQPAGGFRFPTIDVKGYDGKFDYMEVVNAAELPRGKQPNEHARAWEEFWRLLREEFQLYLNRARVQAGVDELVDSTKPPYNQGVSDPTSDAL